MKKTFIAPTRNTIPLLQSTHRQERTISSTILYNSKQGNKGRQTTIYLTPKKKSTTNNQEGYKKGRFQSWAIFRFSLVLLKFHLTNNLVLISHLIFDSKASSIATLLL
jgi:hypothetical protein